MDLEAAAIKIQTKYRTRLARRNLRLLLQSVIEKVYDVDSGVYYYYNHKTCESSWEKPKGLGSDDIDQVTTYAMNEDNPESVSVIVDNPVVEDAQIKDNPVVEDAQIKDTKGVEDAQIKDNLVENAQIKDSQEDAEPRTTIENMEDDDTLRQQESPMKPTEEHQIHFYDVPQASVHEEAKEKEELSEAEPPEFSPEELALIREQFERYDLDASGSIDLEELQSIIEAFGEKTSVEEVGRLVADVTGNVGAKEVEFLDFVQILRNQRGEASGRYFASLKLALLFGPGEVADIRSQFQELDADQSGSIDQDELGQLIELLGFNVSDFNLADVIAEVDQDGDGTIGFPEFCQIIYNMRHGDNPDSTEEQNSVFAKLLEQGIAQGMFKSLASALQSSADRFLRWKNSDQLELQNWYVGLI